MMNDENDCAESITDDEAEKAKHQETAGQAALYMAVYGPDMFGSRTSGLKLAQSFENLVLDNDQADDKTRAAAQDVLESATEKLGD
jgi:hypothetical protein